MTPSLGIRREFTPPGSLRRKAITFLDLLRFLPFLIDNLVPELCLQILPRQLPHWRHRKE